jgi:Ca2+-binding RTX toxin-like protein
MVRNEATGVAPEGGTVYAEAGGMSFRATVLDHGEAGPSAENCESAGGSLISLGANLEALDSGVGLQCGLSSGAGDFFATNAGLTPLAHRGGPTQTHALFNGSPALDAIPSCYPITADQRGELRPGAFACDVGSFERQVRAAPGERCFGRDPTIIGFADSEKIIGTPEADVIVSDAGNDVIRSGDGNDRVCAGKGKDRILGGGGNDRLAGNAGRDRIFGNDGEDLLRGVSGRDFLAGGKGRDRLNGGKGRDNCRATGGDKLKSC